MENEGFDGGCSAIWRAWRVPVEYGVEPSARRAGMQQSVKVVKGKREKKVVVKGIGVWEGNRAVRISDSTQNATAGLALYGNLGGSRTGAVQEEIATLAAVVAFHQTPVAVVVYGNITRGLARVGLVRISRLGGRLGRGLLFLDN